MQMSLNNFYVIFGEKTLHIKLLWSHKLKSAKYLTSLFFPLVPFFFFPEVSKRISEPTLYDGETPNLEEHLWVQPFPSKHFSFLC